MTPSHAANSTGWWQTLDRDVLLMFAVVHSQAVVDAVVHWVLISKAVDIIQPNRTDTRTVGVADDTAGASETFSTRKLYWNLRTKFDRSRSLRPWPLTLPYKCFLNSQVSRSTGTTSHADFEYPAHSRIIRKHNAIIFLWSCVRLSGRMCMRLAWKKGVNSDSAHIFIYTTRICTLRRLQLMTVRWNLALLGLRYAVVTTTIRLLFAVERESSRSCNHCTNGSKLNCAHVHIINYLNFKNGIRVVRRCLHRPICRRQKSDLLGGPTKVKPTYICVCKIWIQFEWIDKIQWFLVNAIIVHSHTLGSIKI